MKIKPRTRLLLSIPVILSPIDRHITERENNDIWHGRMPPSCNSLSKQYGYRTRNIDDQINSLLETLIIGQIVINGVQKSAPSPLSKNIIILEYSSRAPQIHTPRDYNESI